MTEEPAEKIPETFWEPVGKVSGKVKEFAFKLFSRAYPTYEATDDIVIRYLKEGWSFDRIGEVEKCVLRVAIPELLQGDTPHYAVIDDFVTITKRFSDDKAASLVNGILETVRKQYEVGAEDEQP